MLVLTRRLGERIVIAGRIRITVVSQEGGKVRLGITAPESVTVDREEIHQRRLAERHNRRSSIPFSRHLLPIS